MEIFGNTGFFKPVFFYASSLVIKTPEEEAS
jgi:hypothetical protein